MTVYQFTPVTLTEKKKIQKDVGNQQNTLGSLLHKRLKICSNDKRLC